MQWDQQGRRAARGAVGEQHVSAELGTLIEQIVDEVESLKLAALRRGRLLAQLAERLAEQAEAEESFLPRAPAVEAAARSPPRPQSGRRRTSTREGSRSRTPTRRLE